MPYIQYSPKFAYIAIMAKLIFPLLIFISCFASAQPISPDDTEAVMKALRQQQDLTVRLQGLDEEVRLHQYLDQGQWEEARLLMDLLNIEGPEWSLGEARYCYLNNQFEEAAKWVDDCLERDALDLGGQLLKAQLFIEAWELDQAASIFAAHADTVPDAMLGLGRVYLYQKQFEKALALAQEAQKNMA